LGNIPKRYLAAVFSNSGLAPKPNKSANVETIKLPARSPNLNAYAERFVRSIKSECLGRMIPLGERHLRDAVSE
ncbi:MAG: hypothetical protein O3C28_17600, partial [Proteobacteria bacterium]|nr:hypothetical protein [Pseudomonadota bacterium]